MTGKTLTCLKQPHIKKRTIPLSFDDNWLTHFLVRSFHLLMKTPELLFEGELLKECSPVLNNLHKLLFFNHFFFLRLSYLHECLLMSKYAGLEDLTKTGLSY